MDEGVAHGAVPTAPGLWHMAKTYADAAEVLNAAGEPGCHQFDEPVLHLTEQAIELALKGFLRGAGRSPADLKAFSHRLPDLLKACMSYGLDESFLCVRDTIRVVDTLVAVGKSEHGFRYPCNAANRWVEPAVAVSVATQLISVVKERCTNNCLMTVDGVVSTAEPSQQEPDSTAPTR